jgi:tetratricopeptide (TPR) repeat protein
LQGRLIGLITVAAMVLDEALAIWRDLGELTGQVRTFNSMGWVALRRRRLSAADDYFRQVQALGQRLPSTPWTAVGLENAGRAYNELGEFRTAANLAAQGLAALEELAARGDSFRDPRVEFETLTVLSRALREQGLLGEAAATTRRAMEIGIAQSGSPGFLMWALLEQGRLECAAGDSTAALTLLLDAVREARAAGDQGCEANAMEAIGDAYLIAANGEQAKHFYLTAALSFEAAQEPWNSAAVRAKLARCLTGEGRADEALAERRAAFQANHGLRRSANRAAATPAH